MSNSPFRLFIIPTIIIFFVFGLVIASYFIYRKIEENRYRNALEIKVLSSSEYIVNGMRKDIPGLKKFLKTYEGETEYDNISIGIIEFRTNGYDHGPDGSYETTYMRPRQKTTVRVFVNPEHECVDLKNVVAILCDTHAYTSFFLSAENYKDIRLKIYPRIQYVRNPPLGYNFDEFKKSHYPLECIRVFLGWYSPNGNPGYRGPDGMLKMGAEGTIFRSLGDPDFDEMRRYVIEKRKEIPSVSRLCPGKPPIVINLGRGVPMRFFYKTISTLRKAGINNFSIDGLLFDD